MKDERQLVHVLYPINPIIGTQRKSRSASHPSSKSRASTPYVKGATRCCAMACGHPGPTPFPALCLRLWMRCLQYGWHHQGPTYMGIMTQMIEALSAIGDSTWSIQVLISLTFVTSNKTRMFCHQVYIWRMIHHSVHGKTKRLRKDARLALDLMQPK